MRTSNDVDLLYTAHCDNLQPVHRMKYSHRNDCGENNPTLLFFPHDCFLSCRCLYVEIKTLSEEKGNVYVGKESQVIYHCDAISSFTHYRH